MEKSGKNECEKNSLVLLYFNFEPNLKLRWYRAQDLLGSQIPVITGWNCKSFAYEVVTSPNTP